MSKKKKNVVLVEDPSSLGIVDISDAQHQDGELILDEPQVADDGFIPEDEANERLKQIAGAMTEAEVRIQEELAEKAAAAESPEEAEARLAAEIAEDEAIEAENRKRAEAGDAPFLSPDLSAEELQACIETLLFLSDKPISKKRIQELLVTEFPAEVFDAAIQGLKDEYHRPVHGFELVDVAGGLQFRTKTLHAPLARALARVHPHRLSRGAMETLSIIAYRQPVMKEDIDRVRGVDSSHFVRGLLEKRLVEIAGRSELPGRPILYKTSQEFLEIFGLADLSHLPPLQELANMVPESATVEEEEDPRVKEIRKMVEQMSEAKHQMNFDPKEDEIFLKEIRERVKSIAVTTPTLDAVDNPPAEAEAAPPPAEATPVQPELA